MEQVVFVVCAVRSTCIGPKMSKLVLFASLLALTLAPSSLAWLRRGYPSTDAANEHIYDEEPVGSEWKSNSTAAPLFLTPYIEAGKLAEGRKLSAVHNLPGGAPAIESYSGYLTVNKTHNSNIFFWFFPPLVSLQSNPNLAISTFTLCIP